MTRLRLAGLVAAALVLVPFVAAASDGDDALQLAERIASRGGFTDAVVTLHTPPKSFPPTIPLPHATLLGSVVETVRQTARMSTGPSTTGDGTTFTVVHVQPTTLYYNAPSGRDATVAAYEAALQQAGWKPAPDVRSRFPMPQGGFTLPFPKITEFCSPSEPRTALAITNAEDETGFDLSILAAGPGVALQCSDSPSPLDVFTPRSPLPTFSAPSGITILTAGPAGDGSTTGARIQSELGLPAVFEAFAKQLRDAGWAAGTATSAATVRTQTFTKAGDGTSYVTLLAMYALDATHYVALADVSNAK